MVSFINTIVIDAAWNMKYFYVNSYPY